MISRIQRIEKWLKGNRIFAYKTEVDEKINDTDSESLESTYSASTIEAGFVKKTGDTMTGDLHSTERFRPDKIWHAYGGFQNQAETLALDADTWTHVTNATNDLWTGLEADGITLEDDEMIIANAGDYIGALSITITGGNSKDFLFRVYNVTKDEVMGYNIGGSTTVSNYTNITLPLYLECNAGDHLQVQAYCLAGDDPVLRSAIFYISYLHD